MDLHWLLSKERRCIFAGRRNFEGFEMAELGRTIASAGDECGNDFRLLYPRLGPRAWILCRCDRGGGRRVRSEGKVPWIFGAATNQASLRGIKKSGFKHRSFLSGAGSMFFS